jgi:hypothetical protein
MSIKKVGWCRLTEELVLDVQILNIPYLRDDMDVYSFNGAMWLHWAPERQAYNYIKDEDIPEVVRIAIMLLS